MKLFTLAVLAATVSAWGSPFGDRHSGHMSRRSQYRRAPPTLSRNDGPKGPRYGPSRPSSRYAPAKSQRRRPSPNAFGGIGNGAGIIRNGFGDGRGFTSDDQANLEVDINDRDVEFELEADMKDQDFENDLEIEIADKDVEYEIEDRNDVHFSRDGSQWGRGGSVKNVALNSLAPGREQKRRDQSYTLEGRGGYVPSNDTGSLNRGGYGGQYGQGGSHYNQDKSYDNIQKNMGVNSFDTNGEDEKYGYGYSQNRNNRNLG